MPRRPGLTRDAVIATTIELLDADPGQPLSLTSVAERLGVRVPSLYNHVAGLEDLRQGVSVYAVRQLANQIGDAAIGRSGRDALIAIAWAYRDFAQQHPGQHLAIQRAPQPGETELAEAAESLLTVLRRVLEPFQFSETEEVHIIRALRSMVHGFTTLENAGGFGMAVDLDESFHYLVEILADQVAAASGRESSAVEN